MHARSANAKNDLESGKLKYVNIRSPRLTFAKLLCAYRKSVVSTTSRSCQETKLEITQD